VISFQQNNTDNRLFAKRKLVEPRFLLALTLAFIFTVVDSHQQALNFLRYGVSLLTTPLQFLVDSPPRMFHAVQLFLRDKNELLAENQRLRDQALLLDSKLQVFTDLSQENDRLKQLLNTQKSANTRVMAAHVLAVANNRARQLLVLNKGSRDGVHVGLPVIDAHGVMGQIINVGLMTSTVLLISDSKCAVPVIDERTGERAILVGTNNIDQLDLINLPKSSTITVGDRLVTSGLGRRYPEGYPVGTVIAVNHAPGEDFIRVTARPVAMLNQSLWVLLLWPEKDYDKITAQIHQRLRALEGLA
jgi:rod shape-determining protein MreC